MTKNSAKLSISCKRGDVLLVEFGSVRGSEQYGTRPALVISPTSLNDKFDHILVAPITSQKTDKVFSTEVLIEPPEGGLDKKSKVVFIQLRTIDKSRVVGKIGSISKQTLEMCERPLAIVTGTHFVTR